MALLWIGSSALFWKVFPFKNRGKNGFQVYLKWEIFVPLNSEFFKEQI